MQISPEDKEKEDLFNFFGVLNFKIKKYNRDLMNQGFYEIKDKSRQEYFHLLLKSTALLASKDNIILQLVKLSIEANRRNNIRQQTVFKMSRYLNIRLKHILRILQMFSRSRARNYRNYHQQSYYSGSKSYIFYRFHY